MDNLLVILKIEETFAMEENLSVSKTFLNMEGISYIIDYFISDNQKEAKYQCLSLGKPLMKITRNQWGADGTDKNLVTTPLKQYLKRRYVCIHNYFRKMT